VVSPLQDLSQQIAACQQVLHVVEDEQRFLVVQEVGELHHLVGRTGETQPEHVRDCGQDGLGRADACQRDEVHAVGKVGGEGASHFDGEARLADAARSCQSEQAQEGSSSWLGMMASSWSRPMSGVGGTGRWL